jgi:hypothetical protein
MQQAVSKGTVYYVENKNDMLWKSKNIRKLTFKIEKLLCKFIRSLGTSKHDW